MLNSSVNSNFERHETWLKATLGTGQVLEAIFGCIANLCVIIVFFKQNRWNGITAVFMVNLAITDLAICCVMMPLSIARLMLFPQINVIFYIIHESLLSGLRFISIATLAAISYDRMESATRPLRSPTSSAKRIITGMWVLSIPSFLLPIFTLNSDFFREERICIRRHEIYRIWDFGVFLILCLVMFYNYRSVQSAAKHRAINVPLFVLQQTTPVVVPEVSSLSCQLNKQKKRVIVISRIIMSIVLLLWTPYLTISFVSFFIGSSQTIETASSALLTVAYLNHVLHPVLYVVPSSNWREATLKTFPFLGSVSRRNSTTSMIPQRQHRVAPSQINKNPSMQDLPLQ